MVPEWFLSVSANAEEVCADWLKVCAWLSQKTGHTRRAYKFEILSLLKFVRRPLKKITTEELAAFLFTKEGKAKATKKRSKDAISSFFTYLVKTQYI